MYFHQVLVLTSCLCGALLAQPEDYEDWVGSVHQNYNAKLNKALEVQVATFFDNELAYKAYASYFDRADISLPGFKRLFRREAARAGQHARQLSDYVNRRGGYLQHPILELKASCSKIASLLTDVTSSSPDVTTGSRTARREPYICHFLLPPKVSEDKSAVQKKGTPTKQTATKTPSNVGSDNRQQNTYQMQSDQGYGSDNDDIVMQSDRQETRQNKDTLNDAGDPFDKLIKDVDDLLGLQEDDEDENDNDDDSSLENNLGSRTPDDINENNDNDDNDDDNDDDKEEDLDENPSTSSGLVDEDDIDQSSPRVEGEAADEDEDDEGGREDKKAPTEGQKSGNTGKDKPRETRSQWRNGLYGLQDALALERATNEELIKLVASAKTHKDPHARHTLEEYLGIQVDTIKGLADSVRRLSQYAHDDTSYIVQEYLMDKELAQALD